MENQFQSLEDQVGVAMVVEGDSTAHSLEKKLHYQERKKLETVLKKVKKSG